MELSVAEALIKKAVVSNGGAQTWADLGSGTGLFSKALLNLLPPSSVIYAVDHDDKALSTLQKEMPSVQTYVLNFDTDAFPFADLDGIILANALHFVANQKALLEKIGRHLHDDGRLVLIEYDLTKANAWVPFPIPFEKLPRLLNEAGFSRVEKLGEVPSRYNTSNIYSCLIQR